MKAKRERGVRDVTPFPMSNRLLFCSKSRGEGKKRRFAPCSRCKAGDLRRVHRTVWERTLHCKVYVCQRCGRSILVMRPVFARPRVWLESRVRSVPHRALFRSRLRFELTWNPNVALLPWARYCMSRLFEQILELEARLRAKRRRSIAPNRTAIGKF